MVEAATRRSVTPARVTRVRGSHHSLRGDRLATEEPLEIRAHGPGQDPVRVAVTMRTPGHDFELAAGFLATEGLVGAGEVARIVYCALPADEQRYNIVTVELNRPFDPGESERRFYTTSSCGICGKASLESVEVRCAPLPPGPEIARSAIVAMPGLLLESQALFERTGGLHAAGLFEPGGGLRLVREDVGRHNAVDKVVGNALLAGALPCSGAALLVSGRASFEIVQKVAVAGIPILCAVSAPSSLAVEAAERLGLTLVGFLRGEGFNVYAHPERIAMEA
jgi:FdhD protein